MATRKSRLGRYEGAQGYDLARRYESVDPDAIHAWFVDHLPQAPAAVLDVGAGSGRDAAWFASRGHEVVAVDPSETMLAAAMRRHPAPTIAWLRDQLPSLGHVARLGRSYDVILINAVWMHVPPDDRTRAFRKLIGLLKPGGLMVFALRVGGRDDEDGMYPTDAGEIESLGRRHGAFAETGCSTPDSLGRASIHWEHVALRLPDDGTGALPLLRHIILHDKKSSTYKLGLLRTVARTADSAPGVARYVDDDTVTVPLGLIALNWLRLYRPMITARLPQRPGGQAATSLGFIGDGWRALGDVAPFDLRVGRSFSGDEAHGLHRALGDIARTLVTMPVHHMTLPGSSKQVFTARRTGAGRAPSSLLVDRDYLARFGELRIPAHLWRSLMRHAAWIEPALVAEWMRLMNDWARNRGEELDHRKIAFAMRWSDPARDVGYVRRIAGEMFGGHDVHCVWTGNRLSTRNLDIDHCMPWAAWPCDDLWNLLPSLNRVNQRLKGARLPSAKALEDARDRICTWWEKAYVPRANDRFLAEAHSSLPLDQAGAVDVDKIFDGLQQRRGRLRAEFRLEEWTPP